MVVRTFEALGQSVQSRTSTVGPPKPSLAAGHSLEGAGDATKEICLTPVGCRYNDPTGGQREGIFIAGGASHYEST